MAEPRDFQRLRRAVALALVAAGTLLIIAAGLVDTLAVPGTRWRVDHPLALWTGAALMCMGAAAPWLPTRLGFALTASAWTALVAAGAGYHGPRAGDVVVGPRDVWSWLSRATAAESFGKKFESKDEWLDNFTVADEVLGQVGMPGAKARHVKHAFEVTYNLDADGLRVMPAPEREDHQLAFIGCSFAFGHGVQDSETFPYVLQAQAWRNVRVRNVSLPGWGSAQACLQVQNLLASPRPPQCILYAWITSHLERNYLRKAWHGRMFRRFPLFEVADDDAVFQGLREREEATWEIGPALDAAERNVTLHLIESMRRQCELAGVTFVFLVLQHTYHDTVLPAVIEDGRCHVIDVSDVSRDFLPEDGHPTRRWHQAVANALAADLRLAEWTGIADLHRPQTVATSTASWSLSINYGQGARADLFDRTIVTVPGDADLRVDNLKLSEPINAWAVLLNRDGVAIEAGRKYTVRFQVRASKPRSLRYGVAQAISPWDQLGLWKTLTVGRHWQFEEAHFEATAGDPAARLSFALGDDAAAVELKDLKLECDGVDLLAQPPTAAARQAPAESAPNSP